MEREGGTSHADLTEGLAERPHEHEFVAAVRALQGAAIRLALAEGRPTPAIIGVSASPSDETVALRSSVDLGFPTSEIEGFESAGGRVIVTTPIMGLAGPLGVLPGFYAELVGKAREDRDGPLGAFLDIFNHRALSFFYRAARKYRPASDEGHQQSGASRSVSDVLFSIVGMGFPSLRNRLAAPDEMFAHFAGHYGCQPPTAAGLERLLGDYFGFPVEIEQFVASWLDLPAHDQTRLGDPAGFSALGQTTVAGSRVLDGQGKFRINVEGMSYGEFQRWLPVGDVPSGTMRELTSIVRTYVGPALEFDMSVNLEPGSIPAPELSQNSDIRLGFDIWMPAKGEGQRYDRFLARLC